MTDKKTVAVIGGVKSGKRHAFMQALAMHDNVTIVHRDANNETKITTLDNQEKQKDFMSSFGNYKPNFNPRGYSLNLKLGNNKKQNKDLKRKKVKASRKANIQRQKKHK